MGALAALLDPPAPLRRGIPRYARARGRLAALGASYFSASVAARGWPSAYEDLIAYAAAAHAVDPHLIHAIISAESAWRPTACSTSSCGLMQINYTAHGLTRDQVLDPVFNIDYGTRVIAEQLRRRPTLQLALAGYNAGTGRSDADLQDRIDRNVLGVGTYVQTVVDYLTWFQTQSYGTAVSPAAPADVFTAAVDEELPAYEAEPGPGLPEVLAAVEPWMWWALGGAVALGVLVIVIRRR